MQQLYIKDGKIYDIRKGVDNGEEAILYNGHEDEMRALGYKPYIPEPFVESQELILQKQIDELENSFTDDYKIIKCYEAQLMNRPMPYNVGELINARDAKRAQINELQAQLEELQENLHERTELEETED
jgi:hypothetical protein